MEPKRLWRGYGQQGGYGRGFGYGQQDFYQGYGSQGEFGTEGFDTDYDYDTEPSWSYTEVWFVPGPYTGMGPQVINALTSASMKRSASA